MNETNVPDVERSHESDPPPGVPRWVKVFGVVTVSAILLAVLAMIFAPGEHGPGRHLHRGHGAASQHAPPAEA